MIRPSFFVLAACFSSCQTYDFEQVHPEGVAAELINSLRVGRPPKPNVMLVVDRSGSMSQPIDPTRPTGPKRIDELRSATTQFFAQSGDSARFGLAFFPAQTGQCDATATVDEALPAAATSDDDVAYRAKASAIAAKINGVSVGGGTPTAASLELMGQLAGLTDQTDQRADVVLLLTDGLPNCNAENPNHTCGGSNASCRCTLGALSACQGASGSGISVCSQGCLDQDHTVGTIAALHAKKITTVVVGFGADANAADARDTLSAMAAAGGFHRACVGPACTPYFQASNGTELSAALDEIRGTFGDVCKLDLTDTLFEEARLQVLFGTERIAKGAEGWNVTGSALEFKGASCTRLMNASPAAPIELHVQLTQVL